MINLPDFVTEQRKAQRLTQAELATRANTTQAYISQIEAGRGDVSLDLLERVLNGLGYTAVVEPAKWPENGKGE